MLKQTYPPDFLTRGLEPDNGTVICSNISTVYVWSTGIFIFAIMNVKNKDEMQPACFFFFCRDYSKIHLYNQFKIEHVFQTKAAIKIFEDCDVEPMLFVFKHSDLIGHYRYSLLKYA